MHKIPMSETVSSAYNFTFKNFLSVLGIAWFPYTVCFVLIALGVIALMPGLAHLGEGQFDFSAIGGLIGLVVLASIAFILAASMVNVGVMRQALGLHKGQVFIYFDLSAAVWRMIGAMLLACLVIYGVMIVSIAIVVLLFSAGPALIGQTLANTLGVIACIAAFVFYIYAFVRLIFFIAPVVVAEERIGLGRAWELGQGNFWRIIGIWIAVTLPAGIVFNIIFSTLMGPPPMAEFHSDMTAQEVFQIYANMFAHIGPIFVVLELIYIIALTGLINGAQATAYRAVTRPPGAPIPATAPAAPAA